MKRILLVAILILSFVACDELLGTSTTKSTSLSTADAGSDSSVTVTAIDTSNTSSDLDSYAQSGFSKYVYFHKSENKLLLSYNFFPTDADVCSQVTYNADTNPNGCQTAKTVVIPCEFQSSIQDDLLSVNVSASDSDDCGSDIVLDFSDAEFTIDGLVFDFTSQLENFVSDFEFAISSEGFVDHNDGALLSFDSDDVLLEDVYSSVLTKQAE